jgi:hypothetical protein
MFFPLVKTHTKSSAAMLFAKIEALASTRQLYKSS